ncbi:hypothetical protein MN210_12970 [Psychrobacter raelei]|uniref:Uncharacterized protein n=1 Tax=Psychrobacter raelei TaxID=2565531 RepID=A0AAT9PDQ8_9GAMM
MFAFVFTLLITALAMWAFFKFMYPKPPKAFMPQEGDVITPRDCSLCGYPLAEYRGVLEPKPEGRISDAERQKIQQLTTEIDDLQQRLQQDALEANLTRQQKKHAKLAKEQQQKQLFEKQQALKQLTSWFFCNYDHQADFHAQSTKPPSH